MNRFIVVVFACICALTAQNGLSYDVLGIGCPTIDIVCNADAETIAKVGKEGETRQIDAATLSNLLKLIDKDNAVLASGGSCSNTIKGIAGLGGSCSFFGMVGKDDFGTLYLKKIQDLGISPILLENDLSTQIVLSFVSQNGNRTMVCHPGAAGVIASNDLYPSLFDTIKLVHFEGYLLYGDDPSFIETAMIQAKANRALVSMDMSSSTLVNLRRQQLTHILENYIDIIFANEDEARAFTGLDPEEACKTLSEYCSIAVVMIGANGCIISNGNEIIHCPAFPVNVIDTTGAGDFFASGFLHAYMSGYSLEQCGKLGNRTGGAICEVIGADLPKESWKAIKDYERSLLVSP